MPHRDVLKEVRDTLETAVEIMGVELDEEPAVPDENRSLARIGFELCDLRNLIATYDTWTDGGFARDLAVAGLRSREDELAEEYAAAYADKPAAPADRPVSAMWIGWLMKLHDDALMEMGTDLHITWLVAVWDAQSASVQSRIAVQYVTGHGPTHRHTVPVEPHEIMHERSISGVDCPSPVFRVHTPMGARMLYSANDVVGVMIPDGDSKYVRIVAGAVSEQSEHEVAEPADVVLALWHSCIPPEERDAEEPDELAPDVESEEKPALPASVGIRVCATSEPVWFTEITEVLLGAGHYRPLSTRVCGDLASGGNACLDSQFTPQDVLKQCADADVSCATPVLQLTACSGDKLEVPVDDAKLVSEQVGVLPGGFVLWKETRISRRDWGFWACRESYDVVVHMFKLCGREVGGNSE